jgi:hypothetical protein
MTVNVLTIDSEYESACRLGYKTSTYMGDYAYKYDKDIVIRWGNSNWVYSKDGHRTEEFKNVINPAKAIKQNCQKAKSIKLLAQVVNVPTLYEKSVPKGVLAVVRPHEHAAGNDFQVRTGPFKIDPGTYGARFLKTDAEYRVWFCGNRTMCGRRVKMKINEEQEYPCRSNWGYEFCNGIAQELHHQTLMAAKKIGLDVGAADVLYFKGKWYFLELNSAASVDHRQVREFYQAALSELVKKNFPEEVAPMLVPVVEVTKSEKKSEIVVENVAPVEQAVPATMAMA